MTTKPEEPHEIENLTQNMIASRIPLKSGNARKLDYLSWKVLGFSVRESATLAGVTQSTIERWRREDENFVECETKQVHELHKTISKDILLMEFMRNLRMSMRLDFTTLHKANCGIQYLSEREYDYLKLVRARYTASEMLALEKALEPDHGERPVRAEFNQVTFVIDGRPANEGEKKAAIKELMQRFQLNKQEMDGTVEAEYKELPPPEETDAGD